MIGEPLEQVQADTSSQAELARWRREWSSRRDPYDLTSLLPHVIERHPADVAERGLALATAAVVIPQPVMPAIESPMSVTTRVAATRAYRDDWS